MSLFFETIRVENQQANHLNYHQERMKKATGKHYELKDYIDAPSLHLYRCKIIYDTHTIQDIQYHPYTQKHITSLETIESDLVYNHKSLNREKIDALYNKRDGADEILITQNGLLKDTSIANIALFIKGKWLTPKHPLLEGTTRERLLEEHFLQTANLHIDDIKKADNFALMNAMIGFKVMGKPTLLKNNNTRIVF